jgi:hypothetical protein
MIELLDRILKRRASNEDLIISVLILYLYLRLRSYCVKEKILNDKQTQLVDQTISPLALILPQYLVIVEVVLGYMVK